MQATNTGFGEEIYSSAPQPHLAVSLAYQDLVSGLTARQFLYDVLDRCQMQVEFSLTLWNLASFHLPEIQEQAVANACKANLILLSLRGDTQLESETENWLNHWIAERDEEECALAVLIGSDMQRLDSIGHTLLWLQQITRPTHVRLFVGFMPPSAIPPTPPPEPPPPSSELLPPTANDLSNRFNVHTEGGLNE
jgi:hypothetical protein